jgi:hypothetical protein
VAWTCAPSGAPITPHRDLADAASTHDPGPLPVLRALDRLVTAFAHDNVALDSHFAAESTRKQQRIDLFGRETMLHALKHLEVVRRTEPGGTQEGLMRS